MELKLGTIPIRVHGWFILTTLLLGSNERDPVKLALWVAVVFVSVVIHELGHALVGKAFGLTPSIDLHGMGGTTHFRASATASRDSFGAWKSAAISLAGPFAGFLFAGVVIALQIAGFHPTHPLAIHALSLLYAVNIYWGIFNLVPMLPLDGGNVLASFLRALSKKNGEKIARIISIVLAVAIGLYALRGESWWILYLAALFAYRNFQALREAERGKALVEAIDVGYAALEREDPATAIRALGPVLTADAPPALHQAGARIYVVALLNDERLDEAMQAIEREHPFISGDDLTRYADVFRRHGRSEAALRIETLKSSREQTTRGSPPRS